MSRSNRPSTAAIRAEAERLAAEADRAEAQQRIETALLSLVALSVEQTALVLHVSAWQVSHLCATKKLAGEKYGRRWRIPTSAIRQRLRSTESHQVMKQRA